MTPPYAAHRTSSPALRKVATLVAAIVLVAGCGSAQTTTTTSGTAGSSATTPLATAGATGPLGSAADQAVAASIVVGAAPTGGAPTVSLPSSPVAVTTTTRTILTPGSGEVSTLTGLIRANALLVKGSDGTTLDSTYGGTPLTLELNPAAVLKGLAHGLAGLPVGARALIVIPPSEGFGPTGQPDLAISGTEHLVLVVDVLAVATAGAQATGTAVPPVAGQPTVSFDPVAGPTITVPAGAAAPTALVNQTLIEGTGTKLSAGMIVQVRYTGVLWKDGSVVDSSWPSKAFTTFSVGAGAVLPGWDAGLIGHSVGSRVLLVLPPADGYGEAGSPPKISGTDTLVFVIDILAAL
ncbi:MAG: FKBP-type peptidyl-prolyl cis-trans isomerase [Candidatus Phosphoribacter sp.]|nr:FKBP-type peptidyl-prolyl cis-trans isomerase [Actinomycetales bacterium]